MVVFNCNACGEALKKNQVEKHYQSVCRRCEVVSCVDCGKDFWGDEYQKHTKCISEEAKYSGKNYKPKPNANKGEAKQEAWLEKVQETIDQGNPEPRLKDLLEKLKDYPNIPRKKNKFENFLSNSLRVYDRGLTTKVWDLLMINVEKENNGSTNNTNNNNDSKDQVSKTESESKSEAKNENKSETQNTESTNGECSSKLSKRERKEERRKKANKANKVEKKEKKNSQPNTGDDADEIVTQKKKKKRKHEVDNDDEENTTDSQESKKSKKKRKRDEITEKNSQHSVAENADDSGVMDVSQNSEVTENDIEPTIKKQKVKIHFDWESVIFQVLRSKNDKEMSVKKLKKKVISEYLAQGGFVQTEEKLWAKFDKKVKSNRSLKVHKDKVKLVE